MPNKGVREIIPKLAIENFLERYEKSNRMQEIKKRNHVVCAKGHPKIAEQTKFSHIPKISKHSKKLVTDPKNDSKGAQSYFDEPQCHNRLYNDAFE